MREDDQEWSWVGEDGTEHATDESQLSFALSSEELPAYTLVCKRGWAEWLPAMQVAELQWALPAGRADQPRKPAAGHKPKPPLERYPAFKKRARDIARGLSAEPSPNQAPTGTKLRGVPITQGANPIPARPPMYSLADMDEPTLQIDAEALDDAFERLQADPAQPARARTPRSAPVQPIPEPARSAPSAPLPSAPTARPPSVPAAPLPSAPLSPPASIPAPPPFTPPAQPVAAPQPPAAPLPFTPTAQSFAAPSATATPFIPPTQPLAAPQPPAVTLPFTPAPRPHQPSAPVVTSASTAPNAVRPWFDSQPVAGLSGQHESHSPTGVSGVLTPLPLPPPRKKWPWVLLGAAVAASVSGYWLSSRPEPELEPVPTAAPPPPPEPPKPLLTRCEVTTTPIAIAGWAYPGVRPVLTRAPGLQRVAVGYAQTSKLAAGLVLDTQTLNAEKPFSNSQNSPLLSVVPVTQGMGQSLSFLESRAASTLQSAIFVPAQRPFAVGLSQGGIAVRRENEADVVVWRPQWETINVPATTRLDANTHAIVVRAGGERGSMLLGQLDERARALGELQELAPGTDRLGMPSITSSEGKVVVAFDGAPRGAPKKHAYLAVSTAPEPPKRAEPVLGFEGPMTAVGAVALKNDAYFVQYTRGEVSEQRVLARVLDAQLQPLFDEIPISPAGKDAYQGELYYEGDRVTVVYMVRSGMNHEFWATALTCSQQ